jgi:tyrosyl-tRNA synthetase
MFGKIMSIPDELMWKYFALLTDVSSGRIAELKDKKIKSLISPIEIKIELANEIVKIYYGPKIADESEKKFNKIHRDKELPGDMPIFKTEKQNYPILDLLCDTGLAPSKNEAKRLVLGGAVELITKNGELKITDWNSGVGLEDEMVLRAGKRRFVKIRIK